MAYTPTEWKDGDIITAERMVPKAIPGQPGPPEQTGSLLRASPSPQTAPGK